MDALAWVAIVVLGIVAIILIAVLGLAFILYILFFGPGAILIYFGIKRGGVLGAFMLVIGIDLVLLGFYSLVRDIKRVTDWSDYPD
jgi:hypothetical protein